MDARAANIMKNKSKIFNILLAWSLVFVYAIAIFYFSSLEHPLPKEATSYDKILHSIEYAIFGILIFRALVRTKSFSVNLMVLTAIVVATLYGVTDEFHQSFVPTRSMSAEDLLFDFLGALAGVSLYKRFYHGNN